MKLFMMILVGGVIVGTHMFLKDIELCVYVGMLAVMIVEFGLGGKGLYTNGERDAILTMLYQINIGKVKNVGDVVEVVKSDGVDG
jgi:hypothetical protein